MLRWCCVLRVWVCLPLEHQRGQDGRGITYVCAGRASEPACLRACVRRVRVHGVRAGALLIWCVSHTPSSTAVQRSQEELLRNVTAVGDATAQTVQARGASAQSAAGIPPVFALSFFFFFFFPFNLNCWLLVETHNRKRL